jgi:hypothetical protein
VAQLVVALRDKLEACGFRARLCHFQPHYGPGVDSGSKRNEYQKYFLGGKSGRCGRLITLPPSLTVVWKSGSLSLLEPSGSELVCTEIALFYLTFFRACSTNVRWSSV